MSGSLISTRRLSSRRGEDVVPPTSTAQAQPDLTVNPAAARSGFAICRQQPRDENQIVGSPFESWSGSQPVAITSGGP